MPQIRIAARFVLAATLTPTQLTEFSFLTNSTTPFTVRDLLETDPDPYDSPTVLRALELIDEAIDLSVLDVHISRLNWHSNVRLIGRRLEIEICLMTDLPKVKGT